MAFPRVINYAQKLVTERVKQGDYVIDATCGNGNDTLFLANLIAPNGKVYGFDIQEQAIINTREKLKNNNLIELVELINDGHEKVNEWVTYPIAAAMFNLGYLPGSNKTLATIPFNTIKAVDSLLEILKIGGIITIIVYVEHDQGLEAKALEEYLKLLDQKEYQVLKYSFVNQIHYPPYLIAIEKLK